MDYEALELNDKTRKDLPGKFIQLSEGVVHYEIGGPADGTNVVLVHGFSSPYSPVWDPTFEFLTKNGFRTLRYDLYGRGFSDRPDTTYDLDLFSRQLLEIVNKLKFSQFHLVGLSMGGGIAIIFTERHSELVKKITLIDPIGFPMGRMIERFMPLFMHIPGLANLYLTHKRILEGQKDDFYNYDKIEEYQTKYKEQMKYKGFRRALISTVRNVSFTGLKDSYIALGERGIPIQLFWGDQDKTIPYETSQKIIAAIPSISILIPRASVSTSTTDLEAFG